MLSTYSRRSLLLCCSLCAVLLGPLRPSVSSSSKRGESVFLGIGQGLPAWVLLNRCAHQVAVDAMLVHSVTGKYNAGITVCLAPSGTRGHRKL